MRPAATAAPGIGLNVTSPAISLTREELLQRRENLLQLAGMPYEELKELADAYLLRHDERGIYEGLRSIKYLLGED